MRGIIWSKLPVLIRAQALSGASVQVSRVEGKDPAHATVPTICFCSKKDGSNGSFSKSRPRHFICTGSRKSTGKSAVDPFLLLLGLHGQIWLPLSTVAETSCRLVTW